jgi:predicted O-linked N-acetylglucosamine transferase (SPINDLY family)
MQNNAKVLYAKAVELYKQHDFEKAYEMCKQAVESQPMFADAYHLVGMMFHQTEKFSEANKFLEKAVFLNPGNPAFINTLAKNSLKSGNTEKAHQLLKEAEKQFSGYPDLYATHAKLYTQEGNNKKAVECYKKVLNLNPDHLSALNNLSNLLFKEGKKEEAEEYNNKVLALNPKQQEALMNSGNFKRIKGDLEQAVKLFETSYKINKQFVKPLFALCETLLDQNKSNRVIEILKQNITLHKDLHTPWMILGQAYYQNSDFIKATECYNKSISIKPDDPVTLFNFGMCAHAAGDVTTAVKLYEKSLAVNTNTAEVHYLAGKARFDLKEIDKAKEHYKKALEISPDNPVINLNYIKLKASICDWSDRLNDRNFYLSLIEKNEHLDKPVNIPMLDINYFDIAPEFHKKAAIINARHYSNKVNQYLEQYKFIFNKESKEKIRIAYISPDFRNHPVGKLIYQMFKYHDRNRFEIYAYALVVSKKKDSYRDQIKQDVEVFRDISLTPWNEAAQIIYNDKIDILIDLAGYTTHSRPEIMALKPAPVQIQFLGYPDTMGNSSTDYILADKTIIPEDLTEYYTEKILYLPNAFLGSDLNVSSKVFTKEDYGIPRNAFVFCSFCSTYKYEPVIFEAWMTILKQVPESILWLSNTNSFEYEVNIKKFASNYGIDSDRIYFADQIPDDEYLARYQICDLFLDTLYYSAGSTAIASVYMNVPVLTVTADTNASRMGASICKSAGLDDFICHTVDAYIRKAVHYATKPEIIMNVKEKLKKEKSKLPLFDLPGFIQQLESIIEQIKG